MKAPYYKVETKTKNYYYYTDAEFEKHPAGDITKFKGLGQMNEKDLQESMFSNEFQRLEHIEYEEEGIQSLIDLMGKNIAPRKEFVMNNIDFSNFNIE